MKDYRDLFDPLYELYVPDGWLVGKNHLFSINKEAFDTVFDEKQLFLAKEYFISETIFYAKSQQYINTDQLLSSVVYAGCKLLDYELFSLEYDITLLVNLGDEKK